MLAACGAPGPAPGLAILLGSQISIEASPASGLPYWHRGSRPGTRSCCEPGAPRLAPGLAVPQGSQTATGAGRARGFWIGTGAGCAAGLLARHRDSPPLGAPGASGTGTPGSAPGLAVPRGS